RKPLTKEGRDALFLSKKKCIKKTERENCSYLFYINYGYF
ncbi:hypothetical protein QUH26_27145, partial [Klebsiella pneumoniae]